MLYGEKPSRFLLWAQENGCQNICDGLGMLVEQAAESFTLWRGVRPSADPVFNQLRASLMESVQITAAT
jgi:shikimate dehydrogenase